jgi:O-Antigen ligase
MRIQIQRLILPGLLAAALLVVALRGGSYGELARSEVFFVVWWVLGIGAVSDVLPRTRPSRSAWLVFGSLVALAAWTALGAIWSDSVGRTLHEASRTMGFAGILLLVVSAFSPGWRMAAGALTLTAIVVCCLALASRLGPDILPTGLEQSGHIGKRLSYPFNYWNAVGAWAAMTVGLALAWSAHAQHMWIRAPALAGVCVAIPVAYLTYSRAAAAGVVIAGIAVLALSRHRWLVAVNALLAAASSAAVIVAIRSDPAVAQGTGSVGVETIVRMLAPMAIACSIGAYVSATGRVERVRLGPRAVRMLQTSAAVGVVLAAVAVGPALANEAWDSFERPQEVTVPADPAQRLTNLSGERRLLWDAALDSFASHPLRGVGAGTYEFLWNRDERWSHHVVDAHSLYLEMLTETAIPGALLLLVALGAALRAALIAPLRQPDAASAGAAAGCAAALLVFCFIAAVDWLWELTAVAVAAFACAGLALVAASRSSVDASAARPDAHPDRRAVPRIAAGVLAVLALLLQTPALIASAEVAASQKAVRERRNDDAVAAAAVGVRAEPWSATPLLQRALVLERQGFLDAAATDARDAASKESTNWEIWLILARIEAERGRVKPAIAAAERARANNPRNPIFRARAGG